MSSFAGVFTCNRMYPLTGPHLSGRGCPRSRVGRAILLWVVSIVMGCLSRRKTGSSSVLFRFFHALLRATGLFLAVSSDYSSTDLTAVSERFAANHAGAQQLEPEGMPMARHCSQRSPNPRSMWAGIGLDSRLELSTKQTPSRLSAEYKPKLSRSQAQDRLAYCFAMFGAKEFRPRATLWRSWNRCLRSRKRSS